MNIENVEMRSFSKEICIADDFKSKEKAQKEILLFGIEMAMAVLPIVVVWIISALIVDSNFSLLTRFADSDLLWFSITTLVLLNFKSIISKKHHSTSKRITVLAALFGLLVYNAIFIFLQLSELNIINVLLSNNNVVWCIMSCTVITVIINISAIITDRK